MKSWTLIVCLSFIVMITACNKENTIEPDPMSTSVRLRIKNMTTYDFKSVFVQPVNEDHNYGDLAAGAVSDYFEFEKAYSYGYIKLEINGREFVAQPIDFIGETLLAAGEYTWEVSIIDFTNGYLDIRLGM